LLQHSQELIEVSRKLSASEIASLMSVSEKIATLNVDRFRDWQPNSALPMRDKLCLLLKAMFILV
jgi:cytoplasmic iron level regulating protein YaaA (DUF328/UPF0246 family)